MIFFRRHREADARVASARREAEVSRDRLHRAREDVVKPLRQRAAANHFADLIKASLTERGPA